MPELPKKECSAFCPKCGSDLYFMDDVCYCKNDACDYNCDKCKQEKEQLFFSGDDDEYEYVDEDE